MSEERGVSSRRRFSCSSIFWPLLLMLVGVTLLMQNLGIVSGSVWSNLLKFWPVLLILIGLDRLINRSGLVGPTFLAGLGIVLLLSSLGYLSLSAWNVLLSLWPLLIIAAGMDILIRRRSIILSLVGLTFILALMVGAIYFMERESFSGGQAFSQESQGAQSAAILIEPAAGILRLDRTQQPEMLIVGTAPEGASLVESFTISDGRAEYRLGMEDSTVFLAGNPASYSWDIGLTPEIPLDLVLEMGLGDAQLDLGGLMPGSLQVNLGMGGLTVQLPDASSFTATLDAGIGQIKIIAPESLGLTIHKETALAIVSIPPDFERQGDTYISPNWSSAGYRIDLILKAAIGIVTVIQE